MSSYDISLAPSFLQRIAQRDSELRAILRPTGDVADDAGNEQQHDVMDFKDMADEQTRAVLDDAQSERAAQELEQLLAARLRIEDHSYGSCLDCGESIDLRRLVALPGTPYCTACQAIHEHTRPQAGHPKHPLQ
jgi:DnaK suppressor protein